MSNCVKLLICIAVFISHCCCINAQRERNYIYLLDCTGSMQYLDLVKPSEKFMSKSLGLLDDRSTVVILPFNEQILAKDWQGRGTEIAESWNKNYSMEFENWIVSKNTNGTWPETNIYDSFKESLKYIDKNKDNYLYIMTDGKSTFPKDNPVSMKKIAHFIESLCGKYKNTYFYYVMLSEKAKDNAICHVADVCDEWNIITPNEFGEIFGSICSNNLLINVFEIENKIYSCTFSTYGTYKVSVSTDDPHFDVEIVNGAINDGKIQFKFRNKHHSIEELHQVLNADEYQFRIKVISQDPNLILKGGVVEVTAINHEQRALNFGEERFLGKASWYDKFLFWGAENQDTLKFDLSTSYNIPAQKDNSILVVNVRPGEGETKDYKLLYNGQEIENNFTISSTDDKAILGVVFNKDAKEGDRHFAISYSDSERLEIVNDNKVEEFDDIYSAEYVVNWNPLKWILLWTLVVIIAFLVVWFLLVRPMIPKFKVGSILIIDPYFSNPRIHGARKIVFTNDVKAKDNIWAKIFKGKTIYNINQIWADRWELQPGIHKTCRPITNGKYIVDPYTSGLVIGQEYEITNVNSNEKVKLTIN